MNRRKFIALSASPVLLNGAPCSEKLASPSWKHLSSDGGDLPVPSLGTDQTGTIVGDVDGDGRTDFVLTGRRTNNSAVWMRNTGNVHAPFAGWQEYIIDPGPLNLEAGGALFDVDGDGHLDVVVGGDSSTN
jgi:hypothetical protein